MFKCNWEQTEKQVFGMNARCGYSSTFIVPIGLFVTSAFQCWMESVKKKGPVLLKALDKIENFSLLIHFTENTQTPT